MYSSGRMVVLDEAGVCEHLFTSDAFVELSIRPLSSLSVLQLYDSWASECKAYHISCIFFTFIFIPLLLPFYLRAWNYHNLWIHTNE